MIKFVTRGTDGSIQLVTNLLISKDGYLIVNKVSISEVKTN